ncbi:MAG: EamA family transporter [Spirochaetales bacterium]|nr:EamA family transporter [Spirochaetales bacterium]MDD6839936.1 EamA family transporter [Spirochaetales bacterium]
MWVIFAFLSAFFAGITSILAKCGIRKTDSNVATFIRTIVVLLFSLLMVAIVGSFPTLKNLSAKTILFLVLSGLSTGASWLCYFRALQKGNINKVVPIDKSSTVLTIVLATIFLGESITLYKTLGIIAIGVGTLMMIEKKDTENKTEEKGWLFYAILSAVFASLTSILGKVGIEGVESNLGTAIRTVVVIVMSFIMVSVTGKVKDIKKIDKKELAFILLSGLSTGASWLFYYRALQDGEASIVVPIDKLSILVTIAFSYFVFKEKLGKKAFIGLVLIVVGTLVLLIK